ncbi:DUF397 domain-containing protein [Streptomyces sp. NPDC048664]|uniref:DUF397 domain-containing protein n=1 Tax=Streptomyces sp. NPDC048664 TaxID=3154505 RepID=UPI00341296D8
MSTAHTWFKSSYSSNEGGECLEAAYAWRKSSYSGSEGGNCLETAYGWHKSSHSSNEGGNCVEVGVTPATIHIRDSKVPDGPILCVSSAMWGEFLGGVARG